MTILTSSQGTYKYGPVPKADYIVIAKKEDYVFIQQAGFDF